MSAQIPAQLIQDEFKRPGDVLIYQITLHKTEGSIGLDLTQFLVELSLYEDIFHSAMSGSILISDSVALGSTLPIVGGESIQIRFKTPQLPESTTIQKKMMIYKMEARAFDAAKTIYVLHLISAYAHNDNLVRLSKVYSGNAITLIKNILQTDLKVDFRVNPLLYHDVEDARNQVTFLSPNWPPLKVINKLTSLCTDPDSIVNGSEMASYMFFESSHGLNFWSMSSLTDSRNKNRNPRHIGYVYDHSTNRTDAGVRDINAEMIRPISLRIDSQFNVLEKFGTGVYKTQTVESDILRKRVTYLRPYDYLQGFDKLFHMNDYRLNSANMNLGTGKQVTHSSFHRALAPVDKTINPVKNRIALGLLQSVEIEMEIHGRTDLEVGDMINLTLPLAKAAQVGKSNNDEIVSGNYLIVAIQHRIRECVHGMVIRLASDSYNINTDGTT